MTTYMGTALGSMVPVRCLSNLRVQPDGFESVNDGMSGRRIYVDRPDRPALRTWQGSINVADPNAVGTLFELASLRVPLRMVTDEARVGNIFTPGAAVGIAGWSVGTAGAVGGSVLTVDGWAATSVTPGTATFTATSPLLPVVPGIPCSAGVYPRASVGGTVTVRMDWMNLDGTLQSVAASDTSTADAAPLPRVTLTATPPSNIHAARLTVINAAQFARPSFAWTAQSQPWRPGGGAERVYLPEPSQDVFSAREDQSLSAYSYTVTEVS